MRWNMENNSPIILFFVVSQKPAPLSISYIGIFWMILLINSSLVNMYSLLHIALLVVV